MVRGEKLLRSVKQERTLEVSKFHLTAACRENWRLRRRGGAVAEIPAEGGGGLD